MSVRWALVGLVGGCAPVLPDVLVDTGTSRSTPRDLWAGERGGVVLGGVVVSSPRTVDDRAFYVQRPEGGPFSAVRIALQGVLEDLPPPIGTPVLLAGQVRDGVDGPELVVASEEGLRIVEESPEPVVPWTGALTPALAQSVVSMGEVTITSSVDPLGHADTDGPVGAGGAFGITPGFGRQGQLVGVLGGGRISLRDAEAWGGSLRGDPARPMPIEAARVQPEGTPVVLDAVVQATPWDRSRRQVVVQDAQGRGLWVDTEGFDVASASAEGDVGTWEGEIRRDAEGVKLRVWLPPTVSGQGSVRRGREARDGAVVTRTVSGLQPVDALGEVVTAEGLVLDDRFVELSAMPDPAVIVAAIRGDGDTVRHAVLDVDP